MIYTPEQYAQEIRRRYQEIASKNIPLRIGVRDITSNMAVRIFDDGKNSADRKIGDYDTTTPLWVDPDDYKGGSKLKPAKGKTGKTEFTTGKKAGQKHKRTYVESYAALRKKLGRRVDTVNLKMNDDLNSQFVNNIGNPDIKNPNEIDIRVRDIGRFSAENNRKIRQNEKRFGGRIFIPSKKELLKFNQVIEKELAKILRGDR